MTPELDQPGEGEMALNLQGPIGVVAGGTLVGLEAGAARVRFLPAQRVERIAVAVFAKVVDLRVGQVLTHVASPNPRDAMLPGKHSRSRLPPPGVPVAQRTPGYICFGSQRLSSGK